MVDEINFYVNDIGHFELIDQQYVYVVTDLHLLDQKIAEGGEAGAVAQSFYNTVVLPNMEKSTASYVKCVIINSVPFGDMIWAASKSDGFLSYLTTLAQNAEWTLFAKYIVQIGISVGKDLSIAGMAVTAAYNAVSRGLSEL
jgi:hypothetical protein